MLISQKIQIFNKKSIFFIEKIIIIKGFYAKLMQKLTPPKIGRDMFNFSKDSGNLNLIVAMRFMSNDFFLNQHRGNFAR